VRLDVHVHLVSAGTSPRFRRSLSYWLLRRAQRLPADEDAASRLYAERLASHARTALEIDGAVVLALDRPYSEAGLPLPAHLYVPNEEAAAICEPKNRLFLGASVHPYRPDALEMLEHAAKLGAVLIKWLPPSQRMDPASPLCRPFFARMRELGLPLLIHVGNERTLPSHQQTLGDPRRLVPALEMGLTVIAAHGGTRGGLVADPFPQETAQLCERYPRLFLDCSAFGSPARLHAMRQMWSLPKLRERFVYGSDFPVPLVFPLFWRRGDAQLLARARAAANPLDARALVARAIGVPDEAFSRGAELLRS
jgi:predicted TIM-barrel fold metal-dependent hydrolase